MKKSIILFFALLWSFSVSGQIQWQKSLGGTGGFDIANSMIKTYDGGYVVAGGSSSNDGDVTGNQGQMDYWVVKLNSSGSIEWQKSLGGTWSDEAWSIIQTYDSGYAVAGYSTSNDGDVTVNYGVEDYWVVKLNPLGIIEWQKSLGGADIDFGFSIIQTRDSGYLVGGGSYSSGSHGFCDYLLIKLNASGIIQWQKFLGGSDQDYASSIIQTYDSGYMVAGFSESNDGNVTGNHGLWDFWVVKLNPSGTLVWQKSLGGTDEDLALSIIQTNDSGYVVAGYSESNDGDVTGNHGGADYWVVKLNASGTIEWQKSLGGTSWDAAYSIIQTSDSGFVVTGNSQSNDSDVTGNHGITDYWVVKLNSSGIIQWQKCLGGTDIDQAVSIVQTDDSSYVVGGYSSSNDGDVTGNHGGRDYWVVKFTDSTFTTNIPSYGSTENQISVYPNPSTDNFSIPANSEFDNAQLNIFNAMGCNVYSCRLTRETKVIDAESFPSGIYYLQIIKGEKVWGEKIIKL